MVNNMVSLRKFVVPEIVYGEGAIDLSGHYASNLGARKALIVTDRGIRDAGWCGRVDSTLHDAGLETVIFDDVTPNPRDYEVMAGAEIYKSEGCDIIVSVGGGSPIDCAKGIGIVSSNNTNILEFEGVDKVEIPCPPLICIPTTAGTSADVSQFSIILDIERKVKIAIISKSVVPDVALIDPLTTVTMPPVLTAATGMDAFVHAIEAYVSLANSPLTDMHALEAIRLISGNIRGAYHSPNDMLYRDNMMLGSLNAGIAFSNASLGMIHAMAHSLGGFLDLAHGECNSILLEHVIAFNYKAEMDRYRKIESVMEISGRDGMDGKILIDYIREIKKDIGITQTLGDLGVEEHDIRTLADHAYTDPCMATNPVRASVNDIMKVYESAL